MRSRPGRTRLCLYLVLPASVLAGHALAYGVGHSGHGHALSEAHAYFPVAATVAAVLAVAGLLAAATARPGRRPPLPGTVPAGALPLRLVCAQLGLFLLLEAVEHVAAGHGPAALAGSPAVWAGVAAQGVAALVALRLVRSAVATGDRLVALLAVRPRASCSVSAFAPPLPGAVPALAVVWATSPRGPPRT